MKEIKLSLEALDEYQSIMKKIDSLHFGVELEVGVNTSPEVFAEYLDRNTGLNVQFSPWQEEQFNELTVVVTPDSSVRLAIDGRNVSIVETRNNSLPLSEIVTPPLNYNSTMDVLCKIAGSLNVRGDMSTGFVRSANLYERAGMHVHFTKNKVVDSLPQLKQFMSRYINTAQETFWELQSNRRRNSSHAERFYNKVDLAYVDSLESMVTHKYRDLRFSDVTGEFRCMQSFTGKDAIIRNFIIPVNFVIGQLIRNHHIEGCESFVSDVKNVAYSAFRVALNNKLNSIGCKDLTEIFDKRLA